MPTLWLDSFQASDYYRIILKHPKREDIIGYLTSDLSISTEAQWSNFAETPFSGFNQKLGVTGKTTIPWSFTTQTYQGTEPLDISFSLGFISKNNGKTDVVEPMTSLSCWPLPDVSAALLEGPVAPWGKCCSVIGKYFSILDFLLPRNASLTYSSTIGKDGYPVSGTVELTFVTVKAVTVEIMEGWFNYQGSEYTPIRDRSQAEADYDKYMGGIGAA